MDSVREFLDGTRRMNVEQGALAKSRATWAWEQEYIECIISSVTFIDSHKLLRLTQNLNCYELINYFALL